MHSVDFHFCSREESCIPRKLRFSQMRKFSFYFYFFPFFVWTSIAPHNGKVVPNISRDKLEKMKVKVKP